MARLPAFARLPARLRLLARAVRPVAAPLPWFPGVFAEEEFRAAAQFLRRCVAVAWWTAGGWAAVSGAAVGGGAAARAAGRGRDA